MYETYLDTGTHYKYKTVSPVDCYAAFVLFGKLLK